MAYNPQFDLRGKRIENTYTQVLQYNTSSGASYTGQGLQLDISASYSEYAEISNSSSYAITSDSSSFAITSSFALTAGTLYPDITDVNNVVEISGSVFITNSDDLVSSTSRSMYLNYKRIDIHTDDYAEIIPPWNPEGPGAAALFGIDDNKAGIVYLKSDKFGAHSILLYSYSGTGYFTGRLWPESVSVGNSISNNIDDSFLLSTGSNNSYVNSRGGNFGVGNHLPLYELDVSGSIGNSLGHTILTSNSGNNLYVSASGILQLNSGLQTQIHSDLGYNINLTSGYGTHIRNDQDFSVINNTGSVYFYTPIGFGINNQFPYHTLDISGSIGNNLGNNPSASINLSDCSLIDNNTTTSVNWQNRTLYDVDGNPFVYWTGSRVGINISIPQQALDVNGYIGNSAGTLHINQSLGNYTGTSIRLRADDGYDNSVPQGDITLVAGNTTSNTSNRILVKGQIAEDNNQSIDIIGGDGSGYTPPACGSSINIIAGNVLHDFGGGSDGGDINITAGSGSGSGRDGRINFLGDLYHNGSPFTGGGTVDPAPYNAGAYSGSVTTLDRTNGMFQKMAMSGSTTLNSPINGTEGQLFKLWINVDGTNRNLTLTSSILIPSDSSITFPKTLTAHKKYVVLLQNDGTTWLLNSLVGGY